MDAEESLGRKDGLAIVSRRIIAERAHQLRAPRPYRIGVLALHLVEYLRRVLVPALLQPLIGEIGERLHILGDVFRVRLVPVTAATCNDKGQPEGGESGGGAEDRKNTRVNSSH